MTPPPLRPLAPDEPLAVTIATKNRPTYLTALLTSLALQTHPRWSLVLNDQSDQPVTENDTVHDLLMLLESLGHATHVFRSSEPRDRYQRVMEAVPAGVELIVRIDDDVIVTPTYLEKITAPLRFFPDRPVAAVGGCLPEPHMRDAHPLGRRLADPDWVPRADRPTWRLQGHHYTTREIITVESLWGCSMCYRRSAADAVGGWVVAGQSEQIFREDSDMSARWRAAGYELLVTTDALGRHLVAPSGGSRDYRKSPQGNVLVSDRAPFEADDRLFRERLATILAGFTPEPPRRWAIEDLERGDHAGRAFVGAGDRLAAMAAGLRRALRRARVKLKL